METVVYHAGPGAPALETLEFLRSRGFSPETLDDPFPDGALLYASGNSYTVRITVPPSETERAVALLAERDAGRSGMIERAAAQFRWHVGLGFVISLAATACLVWVSLDIRPGRLDGVLLVSLLGVLFGTIAITVILGRITARRDRVEQIEAPRCRSCGYVLLGLREPRCPECGYPFSRALLDTNSVNTDDEKPNET